VRRLAVAIAVLVVAGGSQSVRTNSTGFVRVRVRINS
jgi:hypothetical protein